MASLNKQANGGIVIQFLDLDDKRKSIYLGKCSNRQAEQVRNYVELIQAARSTGQAMDSNTLKWLVSIDDELHLKLSRLGLVQERGISQLGAFTDNYLKSRKDLKPRTITQLRYTQTALVEFFGENRLLQSITEGDADEFRLFLIGKGLAENTVRRRCGRARQFFNAAIRKRVIERNPFQGIPCTVNPNASRFYFVEAEDSLKVLEACPDQQWRTLFALCRWGGLRCPSEILPLTWADVDWENDRLWITSPKTERQGKGSRVIPLFPEVRAELEAAFHEAEAGTVHVITRYRDNNANLRTQLNRIVRRAGVEIWDKPFQNLRSTRETELAEKFPMHIVCKWIGNSELVAAKHYLQMTDAHFKIAAGKAMQNPMQYTIDSARIEQK